MTDKFWKRVEKQVDGCWHWVGGRQARDGYGRVCAGHVGYEYAHIVSYLMHHGDVPDGMCVLHTCDVRFCVNPAHLFLGTKLENMRDMITKGRARHYTKAEREARCG